MFNEGIFFVSIFLVLVCNLVALLLGRDYLFTNIIIMGTLANFFIVKEIILFGLHVTATDVFFIGIVLGINLLEEFFGKQDASRAISCFTFTMLLFLAFKTIHLAFIPSPSDGMDIHYQAILGRETRVLLAAIGISFITLHFDRILYRQLSRFLAGRFLFLKNFVTSSIAQFVDTVLFSYVALYGHVSHIKDLISFSFMIKMIALVGITPFLMLVHKLLKYFRVQHITVSDALLTENQDKQFEQQAQETKQDNVLDQESLSNTLSSSEYKDPFQDKDDTDEE